MHNYKIKETLASGSTSSVKRIVSSENKEYAVKVMNKGIQDSRSFMREVSIHKSLSHPHILKYIDSYEDLDNYYLIIELAKYELCSFIEVDVGIDSLVVHHIAKQLLSGIAYLHDRGICHRDIKPENLLLDMDGNLLITDFGFSTFFRYKNRMRRLKSLVGSKEYMAPEVAMQNYDGESCDVWSIGVTLVVLLAGSLPWDCAVLADERYKAFLTMKYHYYPPFSRIRKKIFTLIRAILVCENKRAKLRDILTHPWIAENSVVTKDTIFRMMPIREKCELVFTQPDKRHLPSNKEKIQSSQPIKSHSRMSEFHRFYKTGEVSDVQKKVLDILKRMVVPYSRSQNVILFTTTDTRRGVIKGEITLTAIEKRCYVTFKRSMGDLQEFKKFLTSFGERF